MMDTQISPDDIIISCNGFTYNVGSEDHGFICRSDDIEVVEHRIKQWMEDNNWFPSIWMMNDHGNIDPFHLEI